MRIRRFYLSVSAATPGSVRPPRNSSDAPPPVEMCVIRSASPAFFTAAIESPPPIMVVPCTLRNSLRDSVGPVCKGVDLEDPHRAVPHDGLRVGNELRIGLESWPDRCRRPAVADGRVADRQYLVRRGRVDPLGHDVIDRKLDRHASLHRVGFDTPRGVELVVFDERLTDREAARLEERIGHRAADDQAVDLLQEVLDDLDLVGDLGAAENGDERPLRRFEGVPKIAKFLFHQQPGCGLADEMRDPFDRCVRSMRRAKRVVDIDVGHSGERFRELRIVLFLFGDGTADFRAAQPPPDFFASVTACVTVSPTQSSAKTTGRPSSWPSRSATGRRLNSGCDPSLRATRDGWRE